MTDYRIEDKFEDWVVEDIKELKKEVAELKAIIKELEKRGDKDVHR